MLVLLHVYLWWLFAVAICHRNLPQLFAMAFYRRENFPRLFTVAFLSWEFGAAICCGVLPWEYTVTIFCGIFLQLFAGRICRSYLLWVCFVYVSKPFSCVTKSFFFVTKFFLIESKSFLYVSKIFLFLRISLLTAFLFVIAVAIMGHHIW